MPNNRNQPASGDANAPSTSVPTSSLPISTAAAGSPPPAGGDRRDEEIAALKSQLDQVLDMAIAQQDEINALKSSGGTVVVQSTDHHNEQAARLDAELGELMVEFKDYPLIEVFERRALVGLDANLDLRLKDDLTVTEDPTGERCKWKLRWFNFGKEGRAQYAQAEGYLKVAWEDLADQEAVATGARIDQYVRKGDRGYEVLHKIPRKLYDYKKKRDAAREAGVLQSERGLRDRLANSVAARAGAHGQNADQAGSFVHGKAFSLDIKKGPTERFTP